MGGVPLLYLLEIKIKSLIKFEVNSGSHLRESKERGSPETRSPRSWFTVVILDYLSALHLTAPVLPSCVSSRIRTPFY